MSEKALRRQYHRRQVGPDWHIWDIHRLVRLAEGVETAELPLSSLRELDENWWYGGADHVPTPRSIAHHYLLVQQVDLSYPILLCAEWRLMDGMHRAVRALMEGHDTVLVKRFPITPPPDYVNRPLEDLPYDDDAV